MIENLKKKLSTLGSHEAPLTTVSKLLDKKCYSQNSFLRFQCNIFSFYWNVKLWAFFRTLSQQFLAELSKLHSMWPEEHFGEKFLEKILSEEFSAGL